MIKNTNVSKIISIAISLFATFLTLVPILAQNALTFEVSREGSTTTYHAVSQTTSSSYTGTLKFVVESAVNVLVSSGGGNIVFAAGDFDLGVDYFRFVNRADVTFVGQGIDVTVLRNWTDAAADTEPFNCYNCDRFTIRDMTISAGGPARSTSDALDFDRGDDNLIERIKVTNSRGRGIVFDGKDPDSTAERNVVRDCVITDGIFLDGIQLLAASNNRIEGCTITGVGRHGIYMTKASSSAAQPNKPSDDNIISDNLAQYAGGEGIAVNGSNRNVITGNIVSTNSSSGVLITTNSSLPCDDNVVEFNTSIANLIYGLDIADSSCNRTVVRDNTVSSNFRDDIHDLGTGTIYNNGTPTTIPTSPADAAPLLNHYTTLPITLTWSRIRWAIGYRVQVATGSSFALPLTLDTRTSAAALHVDIPVLANGLYYWRVRGEISSVSWGSWSPVDTFTVAL
jgi:parallel beta-helix repeat protein